MPEDVAQHAPIDLAGSAPDRRSRVPAGGRAEMRAVCLREYAGLTAYCALLAGGREAGRELAHDALIRYLAGVGGQENPHSYLYAIATNLARRQWRRRRLAEAVLRWLPRASTPASFDSDTELRDAVARLPQRHRDPVLLHYFADLPIVDVAEIAGVPPGTIKRRLHEARQMLAEALRR